MATTDDTVDAIIVQNLLRSAEQLLTSAQLTECTRAANIDTVAIMAVPHFGLKIVPRHNLTQFFQAIAAKCGEPTLRLFYNNLGFKIAQITKNAPDIMVLKDKYSALPIIDRVHHCLMDMLDAAAQRGVGARITWVNDSECHIISVQCIEYAGLHMQKPICTQNAIIYKEVISWVSHAPITCEEISCIAVGQQECVYRLSILA